MEKVIRDAGGFTDFEAIITYPNTTTQIPNHYSFTYTLKGNVINDEFDNVNPDEVNANNETQENSESEESDSSSTTSQYDSNALTEKDISKIDTNGNGRVTIAEAKAAGFSMPIYSSHWLYKYMTDDDGDDMVESNRLEEKMAEIIKIITPYIVLIVSLFSSQKGTISLSKKKCYRNNDYNIKRFEKYVLFISILLLGFFFNHLNYGTLKPGFGVNFNSSALMLLHLGLFMFVVKMFEKRAKKKYFSFSKEYYSILCFRYRTYFQILMASSFLYVAYTECYVENEWIIDWSGIGSLVIAVLFFLFAVHRFEGVIDDNYEVAINTVYLNDNTSVSCDYVHEYHTTYVLETKWKDYQNRKSSFLEIPKGNVKYIATSIDYLNTNEPKDFANR